MRIWELPHNPVPVYYPGGEKIRTYRSLNGSGPKSPEDWVGSTTTLASPVRGADTEVGLSYLEDGRPIADVLHESLPDRPPRVDFLFKLLNPAIRIPVHWHPNNEFAARFLKQQHGKAEAWIVLSRKMHVWLGWKPGTDLGSIRSAVERQDIPWMLSHMHEFDLDAGDTVFVPPGMVHAIDQDALVAEIQQPTSVSILAEHESINVDDVAATLGAGWEEALACLVPAMDEADVKESLGSLPSRSGVHSVFASESDRYFRSWVINCDGRVALPITGTSVLLVDSGTVEFRPPGQETIRASNGTTWLVTEDDRELLIEGNGKLFLFSGPSGSEGSSNGTA